MLPLTLGSKLVEARQQFEAALRLQDDFAAARGNLKRVQALLEGQKANH